ncbi:MAG: hypothetical protein GX684_04075 [Ruminococcaceae bacterium]|nr:hypothetical protein [Oscillospiraceae bacterium]
MNRKSNIEGAKPLINEESRVHLLFILFFLSAGLVHVLAKLSIFVLRSNNLIFGIYTCAILLWVSHTDKKILQPAVRRYFRAIAILLIILSAARTLRYELFPDETTIGRYIWYSYYFFFIANAILLFLSVLYIGKAEDEKVDKRWNLIYIPAAVLVLLMMTNDVHQLAFLFPEGISKYPSVPVKYGILYFITLGFLMLITMSVITITFFRAVKSKRRDIWIPFIVVMFWGLYAFLYVIDIEPFYWVRAAYKAPEFNCIITIAFTESLLATHLLPSNHGYDKFWDMSSLKIGMQDDCDNFIKTSEENRELSPELIKKAQEKPIYLDSDSVLHAAKISGGRSFWINDIRELRKLHLYASEMGDVMQEENELIRAETQMIEDMLRIEQQSKIYDEIRGKLDDKLQKLSLILNNIPEKQA